MLRRTIFWMHLACGVVAGLVVLMMSVTGVLLAYERQILGWAERSLVSAPVEEDVPRLGVAALIEAAQRQEPAFTPSSVTLSADPRAPVSMSAGRGNSRLLDPYTGRILSGGGGLHAFFDAVTGWHRWFNADGEHREVARAITGASNLAFLFLLLSGAYLWLPPVYNRVAFRARLFFNPKARSGKARDFNWHHVFGIWSLVPLVVIVASATVFYYDWANALVYRSFGEEPPVRAGPPPRNPAAAAGTEKPSARSRATMEGRLTEAGGDKPLEQPAAAMQFLDPIAERAAAAAANWRTLTFRLPVTADGIVRYTIDRGTGGQPQLRHDVTLDAATGEVIADERFPGTAGRRARLMLRFLHTGEALGVAGQTLAGLVSLASAIMVWTGLALAWRRLVRPVLTRKRAAATGEPAADSP